MERRLFIKTGGEKMAKLGFETKMARQKSKGAPKNGNAQDRTLPARVPRNYENHPSKGRDVGRGTPFQTAKKL